jgi:excisionase family DNA binding protein
LALKGDWFFVDEDELLSVEEMTRILKVSKPTIQRWCRDRKLPAAKIGKAYRIRREDLDRWYEGKLLERTGAER